MNTYTVRSNHGLRALHHELAHDRHTSRVHRIRAGQHRGQDDAIVLVDAILDVVVLTVFTCTGSDRMS